MESTSNNVVAVSPNSGNQPISGVEPNLKPETVVLVKSKAVQPWMVGLLILIIGLIAGFGVRSYLAGSVTNPNPILLRQNPDGSENLAQVQSQEVGSGQIQFFDQPETKRKSFTDTRDGLLRLISVIPGDLVIKFPEEVQHGSGAMGLGENDPSNSPDMAKIAFINKTGQLKVINSEGKLVASIGANLKIDYLSGWSADSQKIVFHVAPNKLSDAIFPEGPVSPESIDQKPRFSPGQGVEGFYLLDLVNRNLQYLTPVSNASFLSWIDNKSFLVTVKNAFSGSEVPAVFNTESYQANAGDYKDLFKDWFGPQMSFSSNGTKWAITLHIPSGNGAESRAQIILADFPARSGVTIAENKFAYIQGPKISPDGKKVVYKAIDEVNGSIFIQLYDGSQDKRLFEGITLDWIDNNSFIYAVMNPSSASNPTMAEKYFKYDLTTGLSTDILTIQPDQ